MKSICHVCGKTQECNDVQWFGVRMPNIGWVVVLYRHKEPSGELTRHMFQVCEEHASGEWVELLEALRKVQERQAG